MKITISGRQSVNIELTLDLVAKRMRWVVFTALAFNVLPLWTEFDF